jgi:hypothetical protein
MRPVIQSPVIEGGASVVNIVDNVNVFEVKRLLEKRNHKGKTQYKVEWTGYSNATWEPANNIPLKIRKLFNKS